MCKNVPTIEVLTATALYFVDLVLNLKDLVKDHKLLKTVTPVKRLLAKIKEDTSDDEVHTRAFPRKVPPPGLTGGVDQQGEVPHQGAASAKSKETKGS